MTLQPELDMKSLYQCISCDNCGKENPSKRCSRCRIFYYCNVDCQKEHWTKKGHKWACISYVEYALDVASRQIPVPDQTKSSCSVCLDPDVANPVVISDCSHIICVTCYTAWDKCVKSSTLFINVGIGCCPSCREVDINPESLVIQNAMMYACAAPFIYKDYDAMLDPSEGSDSSMFPLQLDERQQRLYDLAFDEINRFLSADPNNYEVLSSKGQIFRYVNPEEAIAALKKCLVIEKGACVLKVFLIHLYLGDAYESVGRIDRASAHYKIILDDIMTLHPANHIYENRNKMMILFKESSRCFYRQRCFEFAEYLGEEMLKMNREWPGSHLVRAQAQWAMGKKDTAVTTMKRAVLYEIPWDEKNRERNIAFLNRMLAACNEAETSSSAVTESE